MPRPDVSDERRQQIIDAAIAVFIRQGYRKTTMPDIAKQAKLSIGGIYWYYTSKDSILDAILERLFQDDHAALALLSDSATPAAERMRAFARQYLEDYPRFAWLNAVGLEFYAAAAHEPKARAAIGAYFAHYRRALVALIEDGVARGEFRPVNAADAANALIALEEGLSILVVVDPASTHWQASFALGIDLLIDGLQSKG
jgi:AcrR family transcriptional regulator